MLVATDGSCLRNPGGPIGWAWAAADGRWASACQPFGTNQVAELWGLLSVLVDFPDVPLVVQMDSEYARKVATVWAPGWARRGWRTASGDPVKNLGLVQSVYRRMQVRTAEVRLVHVPGHDRSNRWPLNTRADDLAGKAAHYAQQHKATEEFRGALEPIPVPTPPAAPAQSRSVPPPDFCPSCEGMILPNGDCRCSL